MIKFKSFKKLCSTLISTCLIITSLQSLAFSMPASVNIMPAMIPQEQINTNIIPFNIGHVTDATYNGEGKVLVLIQDLHSHKQTQENINNILKVLDKKYGIKNIWLEGASGNLDTSWLSSVKDKTSQDKIVQFLLEKGRLTGAELFSIQSGRTDVLKGIENRDVYLTNFDRLKEIYNKKSEIESYLPKIKAILNAKIKKYYSRENRKINALQEANRDGKIKAEKYFRIIFKASKKARIDLSKYGQIVKYIYVIDKQKDLNLNKARKQTQELLTEIKRLLSYQQYKSLTDKIKNKETEFEFYTDIKNLAKEKSLLEKYKEANKFFDYLTYREMLNPIELAEQETELINEIETRFAQNGYEKEVLFLKKYFGLIESYLNNKITADEYKYFENNKEIFKSLWAKYVDIDGIIDINKYFDLFDEFYKDNVERNRYFIENITGTKPAAEKNAITIKGSEQYNAKAVEELGKEKDGIEVVISGGFHTRGLSRLLEEEKINYIVITPNVTDETITSERLYENMFAEEYAIVKEKFAVMPVSELIKSKLNKVMGRAEQIKNISLSGETVVFEFTWSRNIEIGKNEVSEEMQANDIKEVNEQADLAAEIFIDLQKYIKALRENRRRVVQVVPENEQNLSSLRLEINEKITKLTDKNLKSKFLKKLKNPTSLEEQYSFAYDIFVINKFELPEETEYALLSEWLDLYEKSSFYNEKYWSWETFRNFLEKSVINYMKDKFSERQEMLKFLLSGHYTEIHIITKEILPENFSTYDLRHLKQLAIEKEEETGVKFSEDVHELIDILVEDKYNSEELKLALGIEIKPSLLQTKKTVKRLEKITKVFNSVNPKRFFSSKKLSKLVDDILIGIGIFGIAFALIPFVQSIYTDYRSGVLRSEITEQLREEASSIQQQGEIGRFQQLINALERNQILSMTEKKDNNVPVMDMIVDKDFERIFFNKKFVSYCNNKNMNTIDQYNLAINFLRKIKSVINMDLSEISEEDFDYIISETISYYDKVIKSAESTIVLDNDTAVFSIHSRNTLDDGRKRFSPKGIKRILEMFEIEPYAFEALEFYDTDSFVDTQNIEAFFDKIINFNKYGKEKGVFIFDGHGGADKFIYGQNAVFPYFEIAPVEIQYISSLAPSTEYAILFNKYISVREIADVLIKANENGVNLGTKTFVFQDCHSYEFAELLKNILQDNGITNLPTIIVATSDETDIAYSISVFDQENTGENSENYYISSLEYAIITSLQNLPNDEFNRSLGQLNLRQVALAPMNSSNHTVFFSNPELDKLNEEYEKNIGKKTGIAKESVQTDGYTTLQSEKTVGMLGKIGELFGKDIFQDSELSAKYIEKQYSLDKVRAAIKESDLEIPEDFNLEYFLSKVTVDLWLSPEAWVQRIIRDLRTKLNLRKGRTPQQVDFFDKSEIIIDLLERENVDVPEEILFDFIKKAIDRYNNIQVESKLNFENWVAGVLIPDIEDEMYKRHRELRSYLDSCSPEYLRKVLEILLSKSVFSNRISSIDIWNLKKYAEDYENRTGRQLNRNVKEIIDFLSSDDKKFTSEELTKVLKELNNKGAFLVLLQTEESAKNLDAVADASQEEFRYTSFGINLGVVLELFSFWRKDFGQLHSFWSPEKEAAWQDIKAKSIASGKKGAGFGAIIGAAVGAAIAAVAISVPLAGAIIGGVAGAAIFGVGSLFKTELTEHYNWNIGNRDKKLQIAAEDDDVKVYVPAQKIKEEDDDVRIYIPTRKRRSDRHAAEYAEQIKEKSIISDEVREKAIRYLNTIVSKFGITSNIKEDFWGTFSGISMYNIPSKVQDITDAEYADLISENYGTLADFEQLVDNFTEATNAGRKENGGYQEGLYVDLQGYKGEIIVVGDIHANLPNLLQKIEANKEKLASGEAVMIFEGDYIHREEENRLGEMNSSLVAIQLLMNLKIAYPKSVYLLAGNHDIGVVSVKGNIFQGMAFYEYLNEVYGTFTDLLFERAMRKNLALAAETNDYVIVHAGPIKRSFLSSLKNAKTGESGWREYLKGEYRIQNIKTDSDIASPQGQLLWGRYETDFTDEDVSAFTDGKTLIHGHTRSNKIAFREFIKDGKRNIVGSSFKKIYYKISDNHIVIIDDENANGYGVINQKEDSVSVTEQISADEKKAETDLYSSSIRHIYSKAVRFMMNKYDKYGRISGNSFMLSDRGSEQGLIVTVAGQKNHNVSLRFLVDDIGEIKILGFVLKNASKYGDVIFSKKAGINDREEIINYLSSWNYKDEKYQIENEDIEYFAQEMEAVLAELSKQGSNLFQTERTEKVLFKIGKLFNVNNPEDFHLTPLGISLGVFIEPFIAFSPAVEKKNNKKTFVDEIGNIIIRAVNIAAFIIFGRITRDIFWGLVALVGSDFVLRNWQNIIKSLFSKSRTSDRTKIKSGKNEEDLNFAEWYFSESKDEAGESSEVYEFSAETNDLFNPGNTGVYANSVNAIMQRYDNYGKTGKIADHVFSYSNFYDGINVSIAGKINPKVSLKLFISKDGSVRVSGFIVQTANGKPLSVSGKFSIQNKDDFKQFLQGWDYGSFSINSYDVNYFVAETEKVLTELIKTNRSGQLLQTESTTEKLDKVARLLGAKKQYTQNIKNREKRLYDRYNKIRRGTLREIENLLRSGRNQEALSLMREYESSGQYAAQREEILRLQEEFKDILDKKEFKKISNTLDLYLNFTKVILDTIDAQNVNIGIIESDVFVSDMIDWVNMNFKNLLAMFASGEVSAEQTGFVYDRNAGKVTGFVNKGYQNIARAMAKEINRRLAGRDGYFKFSKDKNDEKGYERYNRVKEGVLQILTRNLYGNVVVNEWVYTGNFDEEVDRTAYQMAYNYLESIVKVIKGIDDKKYAKITKKLSFAEKMKLYKVIKIIKNYTLISVTRENVVAETEALSKIIGDFITVCDELGIDFIGDKKIFVYSAAPGTGKDELAGRILGEDGVLGKYLDSEAKMKILHTRDLRPGEKQADKYVFFNPDALLDYEQGEGAGIIKVVYVNGQPQGFVLGNQAEIPVYDVDYATGKVTENKTKTDLVKGLDSLYNTRKIGRLEGGLAIALEAMKGHKDGTFTFIAPFTEEQIKVRGINNIIMAETFNDAETLRLANECLISMIADNRGEIDLRDGNNLQLLIAKVNSLLPQKKETESVIIATEEEVLDEESMLFEEFYRELVDTGSCNISKNKAGQYYKSLISNLKQEFGNRLYVIERYQAALIKLDKEVLDTLKELEAIIEEGKEIVITRSFEENEALVVVLDILAKKYGEDKVEINLKSTAGLPEAEITIHGARFFEYSFMEPGVLAAASALREQFDENQLEITLDTEKRKIIFTARDRNISNKFMEDFIKQYSQDDVNASISIEPLMPTILKNANAWLQMKSMEIMSLFKVKPEVIAVVDVNDKKVIQEAVEMAEQGIKVKLIILNAGTKNVTEETGKVLDVFGVGKVFELEGKNNNLEIINYETIDGKIIDGRKAINSILTDIKNGSLIGQDSKKVLYVSPYLIEGQEEIVDEYINSKILLSASSTSIKGALVKGLLNYGDMKADILKNMVVQAENIYGSYKVREVTGIVLDELMEKGIMNVMIDITGSNETEITEKINLIKSRKMQVVIYGDKAEDLQIKGVEVAAYGSSKKGMRTVIDYGTEIPKGINFKNIIINVAKKDGENIVLTPDIIKRFIVMGTSIAFDGDVLREVSKENTSVNGITMFEIIKAMFTDNPKEKARKQKNAGLSAARKLNKVNITDIDRFTEYIKLLRRLDSEKIYDKTYPDFIYEIIESSDNKAAVNDIRRRLFESIDRYELLGILEGILQITELEKIMPNIKDVDRADIMNEFLDMLAEYRLLTGRSFVKGDGYEVLRTMGDLSHYDILQELRRLFNTENVSDEDKTFAVSGIIELLLMDNLQFAVEVENMLNMDITNLHALLSAA